MAKKNVNYNLFKEAKKYLVGGVNSPVRAFKYVGTQPLVIKRGHGCKIYDQANKEYVDYVLSWGSLILGHAYPRVIREIKSLVDQGLSFGLTNSQEIELAKIIVKAIPSIDKIRFTNSGTEAVMAAVRLARGYTGRNKIVKFVNSYHGHADYLLVSAGSGLATLKIPLSQGVPDNFLEDTLIVDYSNKKLLDRIFKKYKNQIAAVLLEPVGGNYGVIPLDIDFLQYLRIITQRYSTLLIADEVVTGFRFHFGSVSLKAAIVPDLICLGKIIGGGLPIGAYAGRSQIMDLLAPIGKVYQASTFAGNPVVMAAGIATLKRLFELKDKYFDMANLTELLVRGIEKAAIDYKIRLKMTYFSSMFSFKFSDKKDFEKFYLKMLKNGVFFAPSEYEANFLSFVHKYEDVDKTINSVKKVFRTM